ncbi:hypothetical protein [Micromonospora sp. NPDC092111]
MGFKTTRRHRPTPTGTPRVIPQAHLHRLPGRDHQLNDDLSEVAKVIRRD